MSEASTTTLFTYTAILFAALLANDILVRDSRSPNVENEEDTPTNPSFLSKLQAAPVISFSICTSWGYKNAFEQYSQAIHDRYPDLLIRMHPHPIPPLRLYPAKLLGILKLLIIFCIVLTINPFPHLGIPTPQIFQWALQNKVYASMMVYFLVGLVEGQLTSTGAFEISLNDMPVWSKLQSSRLPHPPELFQIIDSHIRLSNPTISSSNHPS